MNKKLQQPILEAIDFISALYDGDVSQQIMGFYKNQAQHKDPVKVITHMHEQYLKHKDFAETAKEESDREYNAEAALVLSQCIRRAHEIRFAGGQ